MTLSQARVFRIIINQTTAHAFDFTSNDSWNFFAIIHGEEFETGMRSDERHLENFGVLFFREFK